MSNLSMFGPYVPPPPPPPVITPHTPLIDETTLKEFDEKGRIRKKRIDETNDDIIIIIASWLTSKKDN